MKAKFQKKRYFCLYWAKTAPKQVFRKFCHFIFLKTVWKLSYWDGENLGLEFLSNMLSTNQIAGVLKILYLKNELKCDTPFACG